MSTQELAFRDSGALVRADAEAAARFIEASRSEATRRAYASDWRLFSAWCEARGLSFLPASPGTVCAFLASQAETGLKAATLGRRVAAIRLAHTSANLEPPTSSEAVKTTDSNQLQTCNGRPIGRVDIDLVAHDPWIGTVDINHPAAMTTVMHPIARQRSQAEQQDSRQGGLIGAPYPWPGIMLAGVGAG